MNRFWLFAGIFLAACSDPIGPDDLTDPCESVFACRTPSVDRDVVSVEVTGATRDSETGLLILRPDSVPVRFAIRNHGTDSAAAGSVIVAWIGSNGTGWGGHVISIPAIGPGEEFRKDTTLSFRTVDSRMRDDRFYLEVGGFGFPDDDNPTNDRHASEIFHLAMPLVRLTISTVTSAVVGDSIAIQFVASNHGRHADAPAQWLVGCLFSGSEGCTPENRTTTGSIMRPRIPPGAVVQFSGKVQIVPSAVWQDAADRYQLQFCDSDANAPTYIINPVCDLFSGPIIDVRPDYERTCAPPLLVPGGTISLAAYNCGLRPVLAGYEAATSRFRFHIVAFDARAGVTYELSRNDVSGVPRLYNATGIALLDMDPGTERIRVAFTERAYIVMYTANETVTIALTETGAP